MKKQFEPIIEVKDDGLIIPEVGIWAEQKLKYFGHYASIFTKSMRGSWESLVYIDLYSGSGYCKIRDYNKTIIGSPLVAMELPIKFDKYIFCEKDPDICTSLLSRINRDYSELNTKVVNGDSNLCINEIINDIPKYSSSKKVLTFCFIDPFSLNIKYNTIEKLSSYFVDFLINLSEVSTIRNEKNYIKNNSNVIKELIDDQNWVQNYHDSGEPLSLFIFNSLNKKFVLNKYLEPDNFPQIRSNDKNLPLYHLVFYSRHNLGRKFWKEIQKYSNDQQSLEF